MYCPNLSTSKNGFSNSSILRVAGDKARPSHPPIEGYYDVDSDAYIIIHYSIIGYSICFGNVPISWCIEKQPTINSSLLK